MATIEIKTLTPVHVGSGRFLQSKTEYVFGPTKIGVIDEHKILGLIGEEKVQSWVASIEKGENLVTFLSGYGIKPSLPKISERTIALSCEKEDAKKLSSLKEQIHNGKGLPYLPGSSIKGAIRSAVLNQFMRKQQTPVTSEEIERHGKVSASNLEKSIFGRDPNHDVFRFLRVGDAYFAENDTVAFVMENINLKERRGEKFADKDSSKSQLVEAIAAGSSSNFKLKFDNTGIEINSNRGEITNFPECFSSVKKLFELINQNTGDILKEEIEFWENYRDDDSAAVYIEKLQELLNETQQCNSEECIMRMAHGSGWTFITGGWAKSNTLVDDLLYDKIVNTSRPGNFKNYSHFPFPKSRRISSAIELPGFIKLRIE